MVKIHTSLKWIGNRPLLAKGTETSQQKNLLPFKSYSEMFPLTLAQEMALRQPNPQSQPTPVRLAGQSPQSQHLGPTEVGDTSHRSMYSASPVSRLHVAGS